MSIIGLLVVLIVIGLVFWAVRSLLAAFSIGPPISVVVNVLLVVITILYLLSLAGVSLGGLGLRL